MNKKHIAFYKPYGVICQFTGESPNLSEYGIPKDYYAAGRLDKDSEGLLILTTDGNFNQRITNPKFEKTKTYWVQVEKVPSEQSLNDFMNGIVIKGGYKTLPCRAHILDLELPPREPPIRERKSIPTCWLEVELHEGKNRQVRSMTAAIGHPTLRLIRVQVGKYMLGDLKPGGWRYVSTQEII